MKREICKFIDVEGKPGVAILVPYLLQHYNIQLSNDSDSGQSTDEKEFANERSRALREMIIHKRGLELDTLEEQETSEVSVLQNGREYALCHRLETIQTQAIVETLSRSTTNVIGDNVELTRALEKMYMEDRGYVPWEYFMVQRIVDPYTIRGGPDMNIQRTVHGCSAKVAFHGIFKLLRAHRDENKSHLYVSNYNTAPASVAMYFFDDQSSGFNGTESQVDRTARLYGASTNIFLDKDPDLIGAQLLAKMHCMPPVQYPRDVHDALATNKIFQTPAYPVHRYFVEQYFDMRHNGDELDVDGMNFQQYMERPFVHYPEHDIRKTVRDREEILAMAMKNKLKVQSLNEGLQDAYERAKRNALSFTEIRSGGDQHIGTQTARERTKWQKSVDRVILQAQTIDENFAAIDIRDSAETKALTRSSKVVSKFFNHGSRKNRRVRKKGRGSVRKVASNAPGGNGAVKRSRAKMSTGARLTAFARGSDPTLDAAMEVVAASTSNDTSRSHSSSDVMVMGMSMTPKKKRHNDKNKH
jgi:hypothetical protein